MSDFAWECECGNVEYSELAPEECEKCFRIDSFAQLPEEVLEERAKLNSEDEFDAPIARKLKVSKPSAKSKSKPTKPKRKKR